MIVGDFNFHIDDHTNASAVKFMELLQTFDHTQRVKQTTVNFQMSKAISEMYGVL